jgi:hypothetical protein
MSEVWSAKRENKQNTLDQIKPITLPTDANGHYQHDDAIKYIEQLKQAAKEMFNPLDKTSGMSKLFEKTGNSINNITTQDVYEWRDIITKAKKDAKDKTDRSGSGTVYVPDITTRSDAQEEADRLNQFNQAVLGVKEGFKEAICAACGTDALTSVIKQADGQAKSIDDYILYDLTEALIAGAQRPKAKHVLQQIVEAMTMQFDFRKKIMDNVAMQKIMVNKAQSFGVTIDVSLLVINLEANMEYAQSHEWGREFRISGQAVRTKYPDYAHKHNQASYDDIVNEYAAADRVRVLNEAPAPNEEQANHVGAMTAQLQALQRLYVDIEESAFAADDASSRKSNKKKKKKETSRGRSSSRYRGRSQSRERPKNKCKHCKKHRTYAAKHDPESCFYNKAYKGWRPSAICEELGIKFKRRALFSEELGGFASSAEESSESDSESDSDADTDNE